MSVELIINTAEHEVCLYQPTLKLISLMLFYILCFIEPMGCSVFVVAQTPFIVALVVSPLDRQHCPLGTIFMLLLSTQVSDALPAAETEGALVFQTTALKHIVNMSLAVIAFGQGQYSRVVLHSTCFVLQISPM